MSIPLPQLPTTTASAQAPSSSEPIRVCVTGAAGQIAYSLLFMLASGQVFGPHQRLILHLLDIPAASEALHGVVMELEDCAFPLLASTVPTTSPLDAFANVDWAIMLGAMPRREGMQRKDLLRANVGIFKAQGEALDAVAKKSVRVVVVGNPANSNCLVMSHYAPSIPAQQFSALTRLDENRARSQLAIRLGVPVDRVRNVAVWGNHSNTQYPCPDHGHVLSADGSTRSPLTAAINDQAYLRGEFVQRVSLRGSAIIAARKLSSAMSAAHAVAEHVRDWQVGTRPGEWVSMAVVSDGNPYGVPKDLMFSFPVRIANGQWTIVDGLELDAYAKEKLAATTAELQEERAEAFAHIQGLADQAKEKAAAAMTGGGAAAVVSPATERSQASV
ncbi:malate dehydrogenase [Blastocladiella britannica]|nr:malate dehydrogenase [Blastocladiella britannica]